jgi:hypothetical protein
MFTTLFSKAASALKPATRTDTARLGDNYTCSNISPLKIGTMLYLTGFTYILWVTIAGLCVFKTRNGVT